MDKCTQQLIGLTGELTIESNIANILTIYNVFKAYENELTLPIIQAIFNMIDTIYYNGHFQKDLLPCLPNRKRPVLNFKNIVLIINNIITVTAVTSNTICFIFL